MILADDDWLNIGIDLASRTWENWEILGPPELRRLAREQWTDPLPGHNRLISQLEDVHAELRKRN